MIRLLTRHAGLKLLSLAVAFVFWLNVASEPEMATIVSVPIEYSHHPANLEISSPITESIDVEASGPSGEIRDLRDAHLVAAVDLSSVRTPGERTFTITPSEVRLPPRRLFRSSRPGPAPLPLRTAPDQTGSGGGRALRPLPPGFTLDSVQVDPAHARHLRPRKSCVERRKRTYGRSFRSGPGPRRTSSNPRGLRRISRSQNPRRPPRYSEGSGSARQLSLVSQEIRRSYSRGISAKCPNAFSEPTASAVSPVSRHSTPLP